MSTKEQAHTAGRHGEGPPHLIIEAGYWRDPVQVCAGLCWFIVGIFVGAVLW